MQPNQHRMMLLTRFLQQHRLVSVASSWEISPNAQYRSCRMVLMNQKSSALLGLR